VVQLSSSPAGFDRGPGNNEDGERRRFLGSPFLLGLGALTLFALGFGSFVLISNRVGGGETAAVVAPAADSSPTTAVSAGSTATEAVQTGPGTGAILPSTTEATTPRVNKVPEGAYVEATLNLDAGPNPGLFRLSGRVPDKATAAMLTQAAQVSYAPYVQSEITVDDSLPPAPWLADSAHLIGLLPSVTDGTIRVVDGKVEVEARSPNPQYLALLQGALQQLGGGMPVEVVKQQITNLVPPRFVAEVNDGAVKLSGEVPSADIKALLEGGAAAAYGPDKVASSLTVNKGTYTSFWMYTMPGIYQLFSPFPRYEIQVVDGQASGLLQGGVGFAVDSTGITPAAAKVLDVGVSVMARDLSIVMTVEGHTDATGPEDHNQALSEARAKSVVAYMEKAGIQVERLNAIGAGESKPLAPNTDAEGRARNRRVEFRFGGPPSG
jgi:outer membrane protein OmpA-like peptidoglycan-associated protein